MCQVRASHGEYARVNPLQHCFYDMSQPFGYRFQAAFKAKMSSPEALAAAAAKAAEIAEEAAAAPVHEDNEWGIEVVREARVCGQFDS